MFFLTYLIRIQGRRFQFKDARNTGVPPAQTSIEPLPPRGTRPRQDRSHDPPCSACRVKAHFSLLARQCSTAQLAITFLHPRRQSPIHVPCSPSTRMLLPLFCRIGHLWLPMHVFIERFRSDRSALQSSSGNLCSSAVGPSPAPAKLPPCPELIME